MRPLFIAEFGGDLSFASEAKALLRHPEGRRELDPAGLVETFTAWSNLPERSAFAGIRELAPAHYLRVGPEGIREERRWWDLDFTPRAGAPDDEQLIDELRELLSDSTRIRLRADVPVAAYLSGGLDSSATATLARQHMTNTLYSFGLGFADERFDESEFQDRIVAELGTDLTRVVIESRDIAELLPRAVELSEKPTLRTALAPLLRLSKAVQDAGLKVVLTGEGADELFAGYDVFRENAVRHFWAREPESKLRPLLFARLNEFIAARPQALGRVPLELLRARPHRDGRPALQPPHPLREHRAHAQPVRPRPRRARPRRRRPGRAPDRAAARPVRALQPARQGAVRRDPDVPRGLPAALAGRPDADGPLDRGPLPVPRLPRRRVRGRAARPAAAARARGEVRAAPSRQHVPAGGGLRAPQASVPGADRPRLRRRGRARVRPRAARARSGSSAAGIFRPEAVQRVVAKFEANADRASETDEMALVGAISTMLLHEQLVANPTLAPAARPTRVVVGATVQSEPRLPEAVR